MFSIYIFFLPDHEYSAVESAIYASLHRAAWSFAIGWILLVCITDNARKCVIFWLKHFFLLIEELRFSFGEWLFKFESVFTVE